MRFHILNMAFFLADVLWFIFFFVQWSFFSIPAIQKFPIRFPCISHKRHAAFLVIRVFSPHYYFADFVLRAEIGSHTSEFLAFLRLPNSISIYAGRQLEIDLQFFVLVFVFNKNGLWFEYDSSSFSMAITWPFLSLVTVRDEIFELVQSACAQFSQVHRRWWAEKFLTQHNSCSSRQQIVSLLVSRSAKSSGSGRPWLLRCSAHMRNVVLPDNQQVAEGSFRYHLLHIRAVGFDRFFPMDTDWLICCYEGYIVDLDFWGSFSEVHSLSTSCPFVQGSSLLRGWNMLWCRCLSPSRGPQSCQISAVTSVMSDFCFASKSTVLLNVALLESLRDTSCLFHLAMSIFCSSFFNLRFRVSSWRRLFRRSLVAVKFLASSIFPGIFGISRSLGVDGI